MKVGISQVNNLNFQAGLTKNIMLTAKTINIKQQEDILNKRYCVEAKFLNNKSGALANMLCLDIFHTLSKKFKINLSPPPAIFLYNNNALLEPDASANFCIPDTKMVLKDEYPFAGRSIFFRDFKDLNEINDNTETQYKSKISSSPHFLAPFIHEWLHSFQLDYIFKIYGYGGDCEYLQSIYPPKQSKIKGVELLKALETKCLAPDENEIVYENLGKYSSQPFNQYLEIFSEAFTKFICDSLKNCTLVKNPVEQLKSTNPKFQKILQKVCLFQ